MHEPDRHQGTQTGSQQAENVLATYNEAEDLINIGAYKKGSNPNIDYAISRIDAVNGFLSRVRMKNLPLKRPYRCWKSCSQIRGEINGEIQIFSAKHPEYQRKNGNTGETGIRNGAGGSECGNRTSGALERRRREYEEQSAGLLKGKLDLRAIEENEEALLKMDSIVATQAIRVEKAKENVETARERMAEAMKERKMHETLREKAFEAFLQEENHAESKAIDELTSYTYGQKNR